MSQLIITAIGPDRPGIVGELTAHLHEGRANLLDSRMVNLRGQFAMLILIEGGQGDIEALAQHLPAMAGEMKLRMETFAQNPKTPGSVQGLAYRLKTYSLDQPGIVARLSQILRERGVNIEELSARQESAAFDGGAIFLTEMRLTLPPDVSPETLRGELARAGAQINCDVDLDPT